MAVVANIFAWRPLFTTASHNLTVSFLDVGHGDAIFIEFPYSGGRLLIDGGAGGEDGAGRWGILPFLWIKAVRIIDAILLTHPDDHHSGGLISLLREIQVYYVLDSVISKDSLSYYNY